MSNISIGVIYLLFTAIGSLVLFQSIRHRRDSEGSLYYTLMCGSNALWAISEALFYLLPNEELALLSYDIRLTFVCYSSMFTYFFLLKTLRHVMLSRPVRITLYAIPLLTALATITDPFLHMLRQNIQIVYMDGIRTIQNTNGLWFWVHCIVCYTFMVLAAVLIIRQFMRMPSSYRAPLAIMMVAVTLTMVASLLSVFALIPYSLDPSPIIVQVSQIIFFYALYHAHSLDVLFTSREAVFENATYAIFILDLDGYIVDYNKKAKNIGKSVGSPDLYGLSYEALMKQWCEAYSAQPFEGEPEIFTIHEDDADVHYEIIRNEIKTTNNSPLGYHVEVKNITPMMSFVHKLQDYAYFDQLTGLQNRRSFLQRAEEVEGEQDRQLAVVAGDINRLKQVNDNYGHAVGDQLLCDITNILVEEAQGKVEWFRVGGDEFVGLAIDVPAEELEALIQRVWKACAELEDPHFLDTNIALAYKVRQDPQQSVSQLLEYADEAMYRNKFDRRKAAPL